MDALAQIGFGIVGAAIGFTACELLFSRLRQRRRERWQSNECDHPILEKWGRTFDGAVCPACDRVWVFSANTTNRRAS